MQERPLYKFFSTVHSRYDLLNRLLTFSMDESWRKKASWECLCTKPSRILDLCTGTGDLALHIARMADYPVDITALDYSLPMLEIAKRKGINYNVQNIRFMEGDAALLPFPDEYFDVTGISFAFRNLTFRNPYQENYMKEIARTLRKKGKFVIIETSQPESTILRFLFHLYLSTVVSRIGSILSHQPAAYRYLAYSAKNYFSTAEMKKFLLNSGFSEVHSRPLMHGIACLYVAIK